MKRTAHKSKAVLWTAMLGLGILGLMGQGAVLCRLQSQADKSGTPRCRRVQCDGKTVGDDRLGAPSSVDPWRISELLVEAIVEVESGGNPRHVGLAGERGLMQIKPQTWEDVTQRLFGQSLPFDLAFDPDLNRRVGRAYLAEMQAFLVRYRSAWRADERSLLLACYNAGPGRVLQARFDVEALPRSTRSYVERATALHELFLAEDAPQVRSLLLSRRECADDSLGDS